MAFAAGRLQAQYNIDTVPFYEGFSGITANNQLPACWATSTSLTCQTFASGKFAAFYYSPSGQSYFYSPGILLNAGIVYSVSAWYKISTSNSGGWTNLSILPGQSQSTLGLQTVTSPIRLNQL